MTPQARHISLWFAVLLGAATACDESVSLLDINELTKYLNLTSDQTAVVADYVGEIVTEIEQYIRTARALSGDPSRVRIDDRQANTDNTLLSLDMARQESVQKIHMIAANLRAALTPEQQEKFDRIHMPDLRQSPQELEFMLMMARRSGGNAGFMVKPFSEIKTSSLEDEAGSSSSYKAIKEERTIVFGPGGFGSGLELFPITVTAILVDSVLAEAEFLNGVSADSLHDEADPARRQVYFQAHRISEMLTIRLMLSTFMHETYIDPNRWIVFIEDDRKMQYEPTEVLIDSSATASQSRPTVTGYRSEMGLSVPRQARRYEIRFPYVDDFGYELLRPETKKLRLVLFDKNDPSYRTFGEWTLK